MENDTNNSPNNTYPDPASASGIGGINLQNNEAIDPSRSQPDSSLEAPKPEVPNIIPGTNNVAAENQNETAVPNPEKGEQVLQKPEEEKFRKGKIVGSIFSFIPLPIFAIDQLFLRNFISNKLLSLYFSGTLSMEDYKNIDSLFNIGIFALIYGFLITAMILIIVYKTKNKSPSLPMTLSIIGVIVTFIGFIPVGCILVLLAGFFQLVQKKKNG